MRRALALARRGVGTTHPNPRVGAIVVRDGRQVGAGWHERPGMPHAEVLALQQAQAAARGATLYVTLEPCAAHGRTPPCTEAILKAGIRRVVIGCRDPNPKMAGGADRLRDAGLEVVLGVEEEAACALNRPFFSWIERRRPWVLAKVALSLDGRLATATKESKWITEKRARAYAHRLRAEADAIVVGAGTWLADNPRLTVRLARRRGDPPLRVVFAHRLPAFFECALADGSAPSRIYCLQQEGHAAAWQARGVDLVHVRDWEEALRHLAAEGRLAVMIEGGARLFAELLRMRLIDELALFYAPLLIGGDGLPLWPGDGVRTLADAPRLEGVRIVRLGRDWLVRGRLSASD